MWYSYSGFSPSRFSLYTTRKNVAHRRSHRHAASLRGVCAHLRRRLPRCPLDTCCWVRVAVVEPDVAWVRCAHRSESLPRLVSSLFLRPRPSPPRSPPPRSTPPPLPSSAPPPPLPPAPTLPLSSSLLSLSDLSSSPLTPPLTCSLRLESGFFSYSPSPSSSLVSLPARCACVHVHAHLCVRPPLALCGRVRRSPPPLSAPLLSLSTRPPPPTRHAPASRSWGRVRSWR
jgi:hypothetical protein